MWEILKGVMALGGLIILFSIIIDGIWRSITYEKRHGREIADLIKKIKEGADDVVVIAEDWSGRI
jgi:hypothetical protein